MKMFGKYLRILLSVLLCLAMIFAVSACKNGKETSEPEILYGDETDDGFGDGDTDGDVITSTTTTSSKTGSANTQTYDDGLVNKNKINESAKTDFLSSVPKKLSGTEVSILIWWPEFDYEVKKMERFTKATGIKVKFVYADQSSYMQKLSSLKLQKNLPDIACIMSDQYPNAIIQDYFQPVDNSKLSMNKNTFDLASMDKLKWNGKRYGAVIKGNSHINFGIMLYNADLFKKYGVTDPHTLWQKKNWNWGTLISTAQQIQQKSGVTALSTEYHAYRLSQSSGEDAVVFQNGKLVNNTGSENYRDAYKLIYNLSNNGQYKVMDMGLNRDGFMEGKCAMFLEDSWSLQSGERYEDLPFTLGFAPVPCKKGVNVAPCDMQLWGFPVGAKNTEAAAYALEYWLSPQFDEKGHTTWVNESAAAMLDYLWDQSKVFKLSTGVIEYGGDYDWFSYNQQCALNGNDISSTMDRWSNVITENLRKLYLN